MREQSPENLKELQAFDGEPRGRTSVSLTNPALLESYHHVGLWVISHPGHQDKILHTTISAIPNQSLDCWPCAKMAPISFLLFCNRPVHVDGLQSLRDCRRVLHFEEGHGQESTGVGQWFSSIHTVVRNTFHTANQIPNNMTMKMQVCVYNIIEINSSEKQLPLLILLYFFEKKYIAWDPLN